MDFTGNVSQKRRLRLVKTNNFDSRAYFQIRLDQLTYRLRGATFSRGKTANNVKNFQVAPPLCRSIG